MDIRTCIKEPKTLQPLERFLFPTGIRIDVPEGFEIQIRSRSGLALKHGVIVLNTPGTVDGGYTNEIGVILINLSNEPFTIQPGDRIAQLVLAKIVQCEEFQNVEKFEAKERRGEAGYGSTGLQ
jgi:dUTP pyrophosphatase